MRQMSNHPQPMMPCASRKLPDCLYRDTKDKALLCRIAATRTGAELLLEQGALACLSSMQVLDRHPDIKTLSTAASMDFYPSISSRYMQILFPALNFCDAILTSLGTKNQSCTAQVLHFLMSHNDTVNLVLHSGSPYIQLIFLKELARLTCIISRASQQDVWLVCEPESGGVTQLHRMQQLMLALFPSFVVSQALLQELSGAQEGGDAHNSQVVKSVLWFFRIACNLVLFARNIVASQGVDHRATRVIFKPTLGESRTVERRFRGGM
uniref:Uncharacterized protein n=1 Tax=Timema genevievae TaxID=629358 RepID=A0A7R9K1U0_TIMGE|nr:unnamed protein product [Timema genevievae]